MINKIKILYIEDNQADARLLQELLAQEGLISADINIAETLAEAKSILNKFVFDVVLIDLGLPDSQGLHTVDAIMSLNLGLPAIIITGLQDTEVAIEAIRQGAQEYFVKGEINGRLLSRSIIHAIERQKSERRLKGYEKIINNAEQIIFQEKLDGTIYSWNKAAENAYGYTANEIIGQNASILSADKKSDEMNVILRGINADQAPIHMERNHVAKNGKIMNVDMLVSSAKLESEIIDGVSVLARDITEEKYAEKLLAVQYRIATIINESDDIRDAAHGVLESVCEIFEWRLGGLWMIDDVERVLRSISVWTADHKFKELASVVYGYTFHKGEGIVGRIWEHGEALWIAEARKYLSPDRLKIAEKLDINDAVGFPIVFKGQTLGMVMFYNDRIPKPDKGMLEILAAIGGQLGVFVNRKNIERQREVLEEQLRIKNKELEDQMEFLRQASQAKSIFLANMSHELRTPLNSVIGYTELMYKGKVGEFAPQHHEYLGEVAKNARHLLNLINQILDLTKIESGKMECHFEIVKLPTLIGEVKRAMLLSLEEKKIQYIEEIDPALTADLSTDPVKVKQILFNYLSNAIKFTPPGGKITLRATVENPGFYRIAVSDTGIGISKNDMEKLFVVFSQLSISYSKTHQGIGLGLALSRHIAELLGGHTGVDSEVGKGSTFFVVLPFIRPAPTEK